MSEPVTVEALGSLFRSSFYHQGCEIQVSEEEKGVRAGVGR